MSAERPKLIPDPKEPPRISIREEVKFEPNGVLVRPTNPTDKTATVAMQEEEEGVTFGEFAKKYRSDLDSLRGELLQATLVQPSTHIVDDKRVATVEYLEGIAEICHQYLARTDEYLNALTDSALEPKNSDDERQAALEYLSEETALLQRELILLQGIIDHGSRVDKAQQKVEEIIGGLKSLVNERFKQISDIVVRQIGSQDEFSVNSPAVPQANSNGQTGIIARNDTLHVEPKPENTTIITPRNGQPTTNTGTVMLPQDTAELPQAAKAHTAILHLTRDGDDVFFTLGSSPQPIDRVEYTGAQDHDKLIAKIAEIIAAKPELTFTQVILNQEPKGEFTVKPISAFGEHPIDEAIPLVYSYMIDDTNHSLKITALKGKGLDVDVLYRGQTRETRNLAVGEFSLGSYRIEEYLEEAKTVIAEMQQAKVTEVLAQPQPSEPANGAITRRDIYNLLPPEDRVEHPANLDEVVELEEYIFKDGNKNVEYWAIDGSKNGEGLVKITDENRSTAITLPIPLIEKHMAALPQPQRKILNAVLRTTTPMEATVDELQKQLEKAKAARAEFAQDFAVGGLIARAANRFGKGDLPLQKAEAELGKILSITERLALRKIEDLGKRPTRLQLEKAENEITAELTAMHTDATAKQTAAESRSLKAHYGNELAGLGNIKRAVSKKIEELTPRTAALQVVRADNENANILLGDRSLVKVTKVTELNECLRGLQDRSLFNYEYTQVMLLQIPGRELPMDVEDVGIKRAFHHTISTYSDGSERTALRIFVEDGKLVPKFLSRKQNGRSETHDLLFANKTYSLEEWNAGEGERIISEGVNASYQVTRIIQAIQTNQNNVGESKHDYLEKQLKDHIEQAIATNSPFLTTVVSTLVTADMAIAHAAHDSYAQKLKTLIEQDRTARNPEIHATLVRFAESNAEILSKKEETLSALLPQIEAAKEKGNIDLAMALTSHHAAKETYYKELESFSQQISEWKTERVQGSIFSVVEEEGPEQEPEQQDTIITQPEESTMAQDASSATPASDSTPEASGLRITPPTPFTTLAKGEHFEIRYIGSQLFPDTPIYLNIYEGCTNDELITSEEYQANKHLVTDISIQGNPAENIGANLPLPIKGEITTTLAEPGITTLDSAATWARLHETAAAKDTPAADQPVAEESALAPTAPEEATVPAPAEEAQPEPVAAVAEVTDTSIAAPALAPAVPEEATVPTAAEEAQPEAVAAATEVETTADLAVNGVQENYEFRKNILDINQGFNYLNLIALTKELGSRDNSNLVRARVNGQLNISQPEFDLIVQNNTELGDKEKALLASIKKEAIEENAFAEPDEVQPSEPATTQSPAESAPAAAAAPTATEPAKEDTDKKTPISAPALTDQLRAQASELDAVLITRALLRGEGLGGVTYGFRTIHGRGHRFILNDNKTVSVLGNFGKTLDDAVATAALAQELYNNPAELTATEAKVYSSGLGKDIMDTAEIAAILVNKAGQSAAIPVLVGSDVKTFIFTHEHGKVSAKEFGAGISITPDIVKDILELANNFNQGKRVELHAKGVNERILMNSPAQPTSIDDYLEISEEVSSLVNSAPDQIHNFTFQGREYQILKTGRSDLQIIPKVTTLKDCKNLPSNFDNLEKFIRAKLSCEDKKYSHLGQNQKEAIAGFVAKALLRAEKSWQIVDGVIIIYTKDANNNVSASRLDPKETDLFSASGSADDIRRLAESKFQELVKFAPPAAAVPAASNVPAAALPQAPQPQPPAPVPAPTTPSISSVNDGEEMTEQQMAETDVGVRFPIGDTPTPQPSDQAQAAPTASTTTAHRPALSVGSHDLAGKILRRLETHGQAQIDGHTYKLTDSGDVEVTSMASNTEATPEAKDIAAAVKYDLDQKKQAGQTTSSNAAPAAPAPTSTPSTPAAASTAAAPAQTAAAKSGKGNWLSSTKLGRLTVVLTVIIAAFGLLKLKKSEPEETKKATAGHVDTPKPQPTPISPLEAAKKDLDKNLLDAAEKSGIYADDGKITDAKEAATFKAATEKAVLQSVQTHAPKLEASKKLEFGKHAQNRLSVLTEASKNRDDFDQLRQRMSENSQSQGKQ